MIQKRLFYVMLLFGFQCLDAEAAVQSGRSMPLSFMSQFGKSAVLPTDSFLMAQFVGIMSIIQLNMEKEATILKNEHKKKDLATQDTTDSLRDFVPLDLASLHRSVSNDSLRSSSSYDSLAGEFEDSASHEGSIYRRYCPTPEVNPLRACPTPDVQPLKGAPLGLSKSARDLRELLQQPALRRTSSDPVTYLGSPSRRVRKMSPLPDDEDAELQECPTPKLLADEDE